MPKKPKSSKAMPIDRLVDDIWHEAETKEAPAERAIDSDVTEEELLAYWKSREGKKLADNLAKQAEGNRVRLAEHLQALADGKGRHLEFFTQVLSEEAESILQHGRLIALASAQRQTKKAKKDLAQTRGLSTSKKKRVGRRTQPAHTKSKKTLKRRTRG